MNVVLAVGKLIKSYGGDGWWVYICISWVSVFTAVGCRFHFPCRQDELPSLLRNDMSSLTSSDNDSVPMQQVSRATGLPSPLNLCIFCDNNELPIYLICWCECLSESDPKWFVLY